MACCIPGCNTKSGDKENRRTLFKPCSAEQMENWQRVLVKEGVANFSVNSRVCILHFKENCIERTRLIYKRGGIVCEEPRKLPLLSPSAIPTIFPPRVSKDHVQIGKEKKKGQKLDYAIVLGEDILAKQREIFKRSISSAGGTFPKGNEKNVKRTRES